MRGRSCPGAAWPKAACFLLSQDESTAEITFYMKGADVAMSPIVQYNDWLEEEVSRAPPRSTRGYCPNRQKSGLRLSNHRRYRFPRCCVVRFGAVA